MAIPLDQFVHQLADSSLMSADEVTAFLGPLPADKKPRDGEQLARELVRQKKLTAYQAQQIYAGKGKSLVLGNYVILDKLGQGGMGLVLKAEHRRMKRLVALKVLSPKVTRSPEALRRFQREVEAAARLTHPNIVIAHDADEAGGTHFLVMEYVDGSDLSSLVKKRGPLPLDQALDCILQAARGLSYAHEHGVVHRDIKPANLLLDRQGTVKILDMGLARLDTAGGQQDQLTGTGQIMGTVDFMAPEQALDTKHADARADIYSLGITLWYVLTGRIAYGGETMLAKMLWEYACRAGATTTWYSGDDEEALKNHAWFKTNAEEKTHPVGQNSENAWGLYDMHGNVWEWCQDWFGDRYYATSPRDDPAGASGGSHRVYRGGGWRHDASYCRASYRNRDDPGDRYDGRGFRLARIAAFPR